MLLSYVSVVSVITNLALSASLKCLLMNDNDVFGTFYQRFLYIFLTAISKMGLIT